jgi:hypothetical protein
MTANVDTKQVKDRRSLSFSSLDDILADAEHLAAHQPIRTTGNWRPAQIVEHVAVFMEWSIDGFPFRVPLPLRLFGRMIRKRAQRSATPSGLKAPRVIMRHVPPPDYSFDDAMRSLRGTVLRVRAGKRMTQPSPLFGKLTHEEWVQIHCRHAEMHFSFMHPA